MDYSITIPAYKEAKNLEFLIPQLQETFQGKIYEINIIDTMNPTDNTEDICKKYGVNYYKRQGGNRYGDAIRTGIKLAKYDRTIIMDADGSHQPEDIKRMTVGCEPFDLTIGSRYTEGGKTDNPTILIFMSWIVNFCFRTMLGINAQDISDSLRIYKTEQIQKLTLTCDNFDIVEEILIKLCIDHNNFQLREVPITFNKRQFGESKRDLVIFAFSYIMTLWKLVRIQLNVQRDHLKEKFTKDKVLHLGKQFSLFALVGLLNAGVLLAAYYLLLYLGVHYIISYCVGFVLSVLNAYYWNNKFVFSGSNNSVWGKLWKVYTSYGITFVLSSILLYLFVDICGISDKIAPIINICITTPVNFLLNKLWAFKK